MEALLSPESKLRTVRRLALTTTTIDRSASTLHPRRIGASPGIFPASSIRGCKSHCRSFAAEPVTRQEKEEQKEREGDEDGGGGGGIEPTSTSSTTSWSAAGWSIDACATLPNAISAARALSAPFLFRAITAGQWETAGVLLAFGAVSDWADGAAARFLDARKGKKRSESENTGDVSSSASSSPLGTYLDPLADKVFIGAAVAAAAGWGGGDGAGGFEALGGGGGGEEVAGEGEEAEEATAAPTHPRRWPLLPSWLAAAIIGRDVVLVGGSLFARLRQFDGGRWPGGPEFFRLVDEKPEKKKKNSKDESRAKPSAAAPRIRPLFVSKLNTALQFATVGACVADSGGWLDEGIDRARSFLLSTSHPTTVGGGGEGEGATAAAETAAAVVASSNLGGSDVIAALAAATAAMTAVSGWAYASAYLRAKQKRRGN